MLQTLDLMKRAFPGPPSTGMPIFCQARNRYIVTRLRYRADTERILDIDATHKIA